MVLVFALTIVSCKPSASEVDTVEKEAIVTEQVGIVPTDTITEDNTFAEPIIRQDEAEVN